ncbi:MAG TPA: hypothetical protein PKW84_06045, partial [Fervidobacterium sp.]|nr:hypothetical protein [Fervidobacterium sp.]
MLAPYLTLFALFIALPVGIAIF